MHGINEAQFDDLVPGVFGLFVQGLLACLSVAVLGLKYWRELRLGPFGGRPARVAIFESSHGHSDSIATGSSFTSTFSERAPSSCSTLRPPRRGFKVFLLDSAKQIIGAGWAHVLNVFVASMLNCCNGTPREWYWLSIMMDCTVGTLVEWALLVLLSKCLVRAIGCLWVGCCSSEEFLRSGAYRDAEGRLLLRKFGAQLTVWLGCVSISKFLLVYAMVLCCRPLVAVAHAILGVYSNKKVQLIVVMVITPCVMNAFQFWVVDSIIKERPLPPEPVMGSQSLVLSTPLPAVEESSFSLASPEPELQRR